MPSGSTKALRGELRGWDKWGLLVAIVGREGGGGGKGGGGGGGGGGGLGVAWGRDDGCTASIA